MPMESPKTRRPQDSRLIPQQKIEITRMLIKRMNLWNTQNSSYLKMFSKVNKTISILRIQTIVLSSRIVKSIQEIRVWQKLIKLKVLSIWFVREVTCNLSHYRVRYTIKTIRTQVSFQV